MRQTSPFICGVLQNHDFATPHSAQTRRYKIFYSGHAALINLSSGVANF